MKQLADRMEFLKHEVTMYDEMIRLLQVERETRVLELESLSSRYESMTDKEVFEVHGLDDLRPVGSLAREKLSSVYKT